MTEEKIAALHEQILVTVVIPTFNRERYIAECIESVIAQGRADMEIIVVDDGSTDETRKVLDRYLNEVRYIFQDNKGVSAARNVGVREARGKYVCFLDSDDIWKPNKLNVQVALSANDDVLCFHGVEWFEDGVGDAYLAARVGPAKWPRNDDDGYIADPVLDVAEGRYLQIGTLFCSKKAFMDVGFFDEKLCMGEDEDWFSRAAMSKRFRYAQEPYLRIRVHGSQTSVEREESLRSQISVFENIRARTGKYHPKAFEVATRRLAAKWSHLANTLDRDGHRSHAWRAAFRAFQLQPARLSRLVKTVILLTKYLAKPN